MYCSIYDYLSYLKQRAARKRLTTRGEVWMTEELSSKFQRILANILTLSITDSSWYGQLERMRTV